MAGNAALKRALPALLAFAVLTAGSSGAALAQGATQKTFQALRKHAPIAAALEQIHADDARTFREQVEIAQIPAPPFKESVRAKDYQRRLQELGIGDVSIDTEGNVIAHWRGTGRGPTLALTAHIDTVFEEGSDVTVREKDGRYYGLGLSDDSRGLAVLVTLARAMKANGIRTTGDILFVGTVGEEGLGNLRGARALLRDRKEIQGFISVDGLDATGPDDRRREIVADATGSHRWSIVFHGPGGHSFQNFGAPSAIHAMGRAIAAIGDLRPPAEPKTTFTVSIVSGGKSINAIASEAEMRIDIRSGEAGALQALEKQILAAVDAAVAAENARWSSKGIRAEPKLLGDRPAGVQPRDSPVLVAALGAAAALGMPTPELVSASTDAGAAVALGIPSATLSGGGYGDQFHSTDEWYQPVESWRAPQSVLLTTLALVGVPGVSKPMLAAPRR